MGWFLPGKRNRSASNRRRRGGGSDKRWDPQRTLRRLRWAALAILLIGLAVGWRFGERYLQAEVSQRRADRPKVRIEQAPSWMPQRLQQRLRQQVSSSLTADPFAQHSLRQAAQTLAASAWVGRVERIARRPGNIVTVRAAYREPVALIQGRDGYHLVDGQGVRLPLVYGPSVAGKLDLPVIRGVSHAPPRAGQTWRGGDVGAGLKLARLLDGRPWSDQVRAIDVSNYAGREHADRPHLNLVTADGLVRWGRAPGRERFYEPSADRKLAHLRRVLRRYRTIDAGGQVVDVFRESVLVHPRRPSDGASIRAARRR